MYTIHIDGELLYNSSIQDEEYAILSPKLNLDTSEAGSLSFVLPPGHVRWNSIKKMKSVITVHQDDVLLFRGRVKDDERDIYNQKDVYCEGDLSFLKDSLHEEGVFTGKVQDFFRQLIAGHNTQVEADKRFTVGTITAVDAQEPYEAELRVETRKFWDTSTMINDRLLGMYGGYLRTRTVGDTHYIDWLSEFTETSGTIEFSVNMLDLKEKMDAGDVFTHLIPLGYSEMGDDGKYTDPVNITSVNGGLEYITDSAGIAKHGKIWRTKTWGSTKDPAQLLQKAQAYLATGGELQTLTLKAVDMHFINGDISMIRAGTKVHIVSDAHGLDLWIVCNQIDIDLHNPENTTYTFGEPPRTLTEGVIRTEKETDNLTGGSSKSGGRGGGGGRKSVQEEVSDIVRWAKIQVDEANANINLNAGEINNLTGEINEASIEIDGLNSEIILKADKVYVDAEITQVRTLLADEIEAKIGTLELSIAENLITDLLTVRSAVIGAMTLGGDNVTKTTIPVVTTFAQASGETASTTDFTLLTTAVSDTITHDVANGEIKTF